MFKGVDWIEEELTLESKAADAVLQEALASGNYADAEILVLDGKATALPGEVAKLPKLRELHILSSKVAAVGPALFACAALEQLSLGESKVKSLPNGGWARLTKLRALELCATLEALPEDLGDAPALGGRFDLADFPKLKRLPPSMGRLTQLSWLRVARGCTELPPSVAGWTSLRELHLAESKVSRLPDDLGAAKALTVLHAVSARLEALPDSIDGCVALKELHLGGNRLADLPASITRLPQLEKLDLAGNPIAALPDGMGRLPLKGLSLLDTRIDRLPADLAATSAQRVLLPAAQRPALEANSAAVLAALGARAQFS